MIPSRQEINSYGDHLIGNPSAVIMNPVVSCWDGVVDGSGFSDAEFMAMYDCTQSIFADVPAGLPIEIVPSMTKSIMSDCDVRSYDNMIDSPGLACSSLYESCYNEGLQTHASQQQAVNTNNGSDLSKLWGKMAGPGSSTPPLKNVPRNRSEKAKLLNHNRKTIMNERLQALQKLLPESLKGNSRDSIIENTMGQIKHLQHQIKELSASRLEGESISAPLNNLEGHGHYYACDKMDSESLEEVVGNLMDENVIAASKLLEGKGLYIVPIASIDALHGANEI